MHPSTLRLTFRYQGDRIELLSQRRVEMIAPASAAERPVPNRNSGFWVELRDEHDQVLFYRVLHNPIPYIVEAPLPDGTLRSVAGPPASTEFEVLVPDVPGAASIVLFSSPLQLERSQEPAQEVARFPLERTQPPGQARP